MTNVRYCHEIILSASGGLAGEHADRLYAACARPFQTAFGEFIHPTVFDQAGALLHGIIAGHVFVDGNKRTAVVATTLFLAARGAIAGGIPSQLQVSLLGEVALATARSELDAGEVARWLGRILG